MKKLPAFLRFSPIYKDYLWGGDRIPARFGRRGAPAVCAESWEISAHPDGDSAVADGPLAGRTLSSLVTEFGRDLLGSRAPSATRFPLLCKIIDARQSLSVQVHPSPSDPGADPAEYKNECWHCLDADAGTTIFAGLSESIRDAGALRRLALEDPKALAGALLRHAPKVGETLYIPAGLVHAIGAGALVYEVQQNSNTTYRLYDWDRRGPDGKPRKLHFEEALRSIDFSLPAPRFTAPSDDGAGDGVLCLKTPYFTIREIRAGLRRRLGGESFNIVFVKSGGFELSGSGTDGNRSAATLEAGDSVLVPASSEYSLEPRGDAAALVTSL